jgi:hypothetical protein
MLSSLLSSGSKTGTRTDPPQTFVELPFLAGGNREERLRPEDLITFMPVAGLGDDERYGRGVTERNSDVPRRHACAERPTVEDSAIIFPPHFDSDEGLVAARDGVREPYDSLESNRIRRHREKHVRPCVDADAEFVGRPAHSDRLSVWRGFELRRCGAVIDLAHLGLGEG